MLRATGIELTHTERLPSIWTVALYLEELNAFIRPFLIIMSYLHWVGFWMRSRAPTRDAPTEEVRPPKELGFGSRRAVRPVRGGS